MKEIKFRDLRPDEIECRVGATLKDQNGNPYAFQIMLYKTSRTDMAILDETFGTFGWKNSFYQVKNTMVCSISIWDEEKKEWVNKDNGGDDDFTMEQVKAELSDSIKRSGSTLGIGRKLYSASKIYMVVNIDKDNDPKKSKYIVKDIAYDDYGITKIVISNKKTHQVVISYGSDEKVSQTSQKGQENTTTTPKASYTPNDIMQEQANCITKVKDFATNLPAENYKKFFGWLEEKYGTRVINNLTLDQLKEIIKLYKL